MLPPLPNKIDFETVAMGATANSSAGAYIHADTTITCRIDGDPTGVFSIIKVETEDVVQDPDVPPGHPAQMVLEPDLIVNGPGPIDVAAGQALIVYVSFTCPDHVVDHVFNALVHAEGPGLIKPVAFPIRGVPQFGSMGAEALSVPLFFANQTQNTEFRIDSSLDQPFNVSFLYDSSSDPHFTAPTQSTSVPAAGSSEPFVVPVTCFAGTPSGDYFLSFRLIASDHTRDFGLTQVPVSVAAVPVPQNIATTVDTTSLAMTSGGITPINVTLQSLKGSDTQVSFALEGSPAGFGLSGPPIPVKAGATVQGTVWLNAAPDAPQDSILQLVQTAFGGAQIVHLPTKIFVSALPPPPLQTFLVVRIYWGATWPTGLPYTWQTLDDTFLILANSAFVKGLREYGVLSLSTSAGAQPTTAVNPSFPASGRFSFGDLIGLVTGMLDAGQLVRPKDFNAPVLYLVVPPEGSVFTDTAIDIGSHGTFSYQNIDCMLAWAFQDADIGVTTRVMGHEIAEAICKNQAGMEIGDPCNALIGPCDTVNVEAYFSKQRGLCILPNLTNDASTAATPPVPGVTSS